MRYFSAIFLSVILCVGCFQKTTTDTELIIKTLVEPKSGADDVAASEVIAYAYYTENNKWMVASYEDALNKVVTDSMGVNKKTIPDVEGIPYTKEGDTGNYTSLMLNQSPAFVVVVCPEVRMYATLFKYLNVVNLHQTYMTLLLHPWKTAPYTEGTEKKGGVWNIMPPAPEQTPEETPEETPDSEQTTEQDSMQK